MARKSANSTGTHRHHQDSNLDLTGRKRVFSTASALPFNCRYIWSYYFAKLESVRLYLLYLRTYFLPVLRSFFFLSVWKELTLLGSLLAYFEIFVTCTLAKGDKLLSLFLPFSDIQVHLIGTGRRNWEQNSDQREFSRPTVVKSSSRRYPFLRTISSVRLGLLPLGIQKWSFT